MVDTRRRKVWITLACLVLSVPLAWLAAERVRGRRGAQVEHFRPTRSAVRVLTEYARSDPGPEWIRATPESTLRRFRIPRRFADELFPLGHAYNRYDEQAYFVHEPGLDELRQFPDHPDGAWTMRTDSLGLRRDGEVSPVPPDLRVLVLGDSHTEGICNNAESFSGVAEAELSARAPGRTVEVLNAARGGYSFYNYLGALEKYGTLEPDVVVAVSTTSNDFTDLLTLAHVFDGSAMPPLAADASRRIKRARERDRNACGAGFGSLLYLSENPGEVDFALEAAVAICIELERVSEAGGARFVLGLLPSPCFLAWRSEPEGLRDVRAILGLDAEDEALFEGLVRRFLARLAEAGIEVLDLRPSLAADPDRYFWPSDYHLDVDGHRVVADVLVRELERDLAGGD